MKKWFLFLSLGLLLFAAVYLQWDSHPVNWKLLNAQVEGRLIQVHSPLAENQIDPELWKSLQNPFTIEEHPWGTQSTGWMDAWSTSASSYAVAAEKTSDIVAAVQFARKNNIKLVVKGTGHDYLGRSNAPDSLLVWTHPMRRVEIVDHFIPQGAPSHTSGIPAVTIEAGARWIEVYEEVTTKHGRYVQGGGCATVGAVGGFLQGGGFGSFSKKYGIAAASLLEAEVVVASGEVLIVNEYQHSDLFWALKGGGGSTFGVVAKATLQTHDLPQYFGFLHGHVAAKNDAAFEELLAYFIRFYRESLGNEHWGEQVAIKPDNSLDLSLVFQGLNEKEEEAIWQPFYEWIEEHKDLYSLTSQFSVIPASKFWDYNYLAKNFPHFITSTDGKFYWSSNQGEVLSYWYAMYSRWLPMALFEEEAKLAKTLFQASRYAALSLHFNKGLGYASPEALQRSKNTAINPVVLDAPALLILDAKEQYVFPGIKNHEPDKEKGKEQRRLVNKAAQMILDITPESGSYSNEADYFQKDWQHEFWGEHYPRLLEIKKKYDPEGFFQCHHSVGS